MSVIKKELTIQEIVSIFEVNILKTQLALKQIVGAVTYLHSYENMNSDFEKITEVIKDNNITSIDMNDLPKELKSEFSNELLVLYSLNVMINQFQTIETETKKTNIISL